MIAIAVDDEYIALKMLEREMKKIPELQEVYTFSNAKEALEFAQTNQIELAVLDISMPQMDGLTLGRKLRELLPKIILIYATAYTQYAADAFKLHAQSYLEKPITSEALENELQYLRDPVIIPENRPKVYIQTFGNFDIFVDDKLLAFTKSKAKELLAYLVDRKGASVTTAEIAGILWEDKEYNRNTKTQVVRVIADLKEVLEKAGVEDILIKKWGSVSIDLSKVDCDYIRLTQGDTSVLSGFQGQYMNNYSWAEETTAEIEFSLQK